MFIQLARLAVAGYLVLKTARHGVISYLRGFKSTQQATELSSFGMMASASDDNSVHGAGAMLQGLGASSRNAIRNHNIQTAGYAATGLLLSYAAFRVASLGSPIGLAANVISGASLAYDGYKVLRNYF